MSERLDVVNELDEIIKVEERGTIHKQRLLHRAVHIFVFNSKGELFIQKRASNKDEHPNRYDSSAAGHLESGENYDTAAKRELKEELGISPKTLDKLMRIKACSETGNEFVYLYTVTTDDNIKINEDEIQEGFFLTLDETKRKIKSQAESFTPAFILLFNEYINAKSRSK